MKSESSVLIIILIIFIRSAIYSQHETVSNGKWYWPSTWSTDPNSTFYPGENDDVVINHDVSEGGECRNLTVNESGRILVGGIIVHGNVINSGYIGDDPNHDSDEFTARFYGDIANAGTMSIQTTYLRGTSDQNIKGGDEVVTVLGACYDTDPNSAVVFQGSQTIKNSYLLMGEIKQNYL